MVYGGSVLEQGAGRGWTGHTETPAEIPQTAHTGQHGRMYPYFPLELDLLSHSGFHLHDGDLTREKIQDLHHSIRLTVTSPEFNNQEELDHQDTR